MGDVAHPQAGTIRRAAVIDVSLSDRLGDGFDEPHVVDDVTLAFLPLSAT